MLQKLRDSGDLSTVYSEVEAAEAEARKLSLRLLDFLNTHSSRTLVYAYTGYGAIPAFISYWYSITMSNRSVVVGEADDVALYILPYRDDVSVLVYSTGEYGKLVNLVQAARILDIDLLAVAPVPADERLKTIVKYYMINTFNAKDMYEAALVLTLASFFSHSQLFKNALQTRGKRLFEHGEEGFAITVQTLIQKYAPILEKVLALGELYVSSSKLLEPSSQLLAHVLADLGVGATYVPTSELTSARKPVLLVYASTEERSFRELKTTRKLEPMELVFNTDPLEANVYVTLIAYTLRKLYS